MSYEIKRGERICVNICMAEEKSGSKKGSKATRESSRSARSASRRRSKVRTMKSGQETTKNNRSKSGHKRAKSSGTRNRAASQTKTQKQQKSNVKSIPDLDKCILPQMSRTTRLSATSHMEPRYEPHTTYKPMVPSEVQNQDNYTGHLTQPTQTTKRAMTPKKNKTLAKASSKKRGGCE